MATLPANVAPFSLEVLGPDGASYKRGRHKSILAPVPATNFKPHKMRIDGIALSEAGAEVAARLGTVAANTYKLVDLSGEFWGVQSPEGEIRTVRKTKDEAISKAVQDIIDGARAGGAEAGVVVVDGERRIHYPGREETVNLFAPFVVALTGSSAIELRDIDGGVYAAFALADREAGGLVPALRRGVPMRAYPLPEAPRPADLVVRFAEKR